MRLTDTDVGTNTNRVEINTRNIEPDTSNTGNYTNHTYRYINTLGISDESWTYKLKHLILSLKDACITNVTLYGWGDNTWSQLGTFGSNKVY